MITNLFKKEIIIFTVLTFFTFSVGFSEGLNEKESAEENVTNSIKLVIDRFVAISSQKKTSLAEKKEKIRNLYYENVDFKKFSQATLRRVWKELDTEQKKSYTKKFNQFVVSFYLGRLKWYENNEVTFKGVKLKSSGKSALVQTAVAYKNTQITLDYYMIKKGGRWYIYDFGVEGIRISSTYHHQFEKVFREGGYKKLNKNLDKILKQYDKK